MLKTLKPSTYEDYARLPDDKRYELIWGEILEAPSPDAEHQEFLGELYSIILAYVKRLQLGRVFLAPFDVVLDEHNTVQPDIVFVSKAREKIITRNNIQGAPDLVIEITSPGTGDCDRLVKKKLYEEHGVPEFWLADREAKAVTVFALSRGRYGVHGVFGERDTLTSRALRGLKVDLAPLFRLRR